MDEVRAAVAGQCCKCALRSLISLNSLEKENQMSVYETSFMVIDYWLPKIIYGVHYITARTSFLLQLVLFFSVKREIRIDATTREVTIRFRRWWTASSFETIPFSTISHIDISEITVGTSPGYTPDGVGWRDQQENYIPFLITTSGKRIELLSFYGKGSVQTGWWGVLLGDQIIDLKGRQEKRAIEFATRVAQMVGVPFGVESKVVSEARSTDGKIKCASCGHYNARGHKKCLYCGSEIGMRE